MPQKGPGSILKTAVDPHFGALVKQTILLLALSLNHGLQAAVTGAAAPVSPAAAAPTPPKAPQPLSPPAQAQPLSPTAEPEAAVEPEDADQPLAPAQPAVVADLKPLSSTVLAALAAALDPEQASLWFDAESGEAVDEGTAGAARVDAEGLFEELALRLARHEDKDARAALGLAIMKKDARAAEAKNLAFEDKLADSVIALQEKGDAKAKTQLEALAAKGNRRARRHLGLDAPPAETPPAAGGPTAVSPTAVSPAAASPTAKP